jgi:lysophospholipase L1-like esterase
MNDDSIMLLSCHNNHWIIIIKVWMTLKRPTIINCSFFIASLLLSFLICEITVRTLKIAPELAPITIEGKDAEFRFSTGDPRIIYEPIPNIGDINSDGLRDIDHDITKPSNTHRIVVLGDSIAYGYCTNRENIKINDIFSTKLTKKLNNRKVSKQEFQSINLSVSGYSTQQELGRLIEKGLRYKPDTVLVAYCMNDDETLNQSRELGGFMNDGRFVESFNLLRMMRKNFLMESEFIRLIWVSLNSFELLKTPSTALDSLEYEERVRLGFSELSELSLNNNFKVVITIFPHLHYQRKGKYTIADRHEAVKKIAENYGFLVIDLLPIFLQHSDNNLRQLAGRCSSMHLDENGHNFSAEIVAEFFENNASHLNF